MREFRVREVNVSLSSRVNSEKGFFLALALTSCVIFGEGNGNPLQCSCLEDPRDEGAWWAAFYGVAQSRTWLKRLSSSSSIPTDRVQ